jgi:hypothetical protein
VNDCNGWGRDGEEDDDDEDEDDGDDERDWRSIVTVDDDDFLFWSFDEKDVCWCRLSIIGSVENIFRRVIGFGDKVSLSRSSFICWQSKLNADRLFSGRIRTTSISSCCSRFVDVSSNVGETVTGAIKRCWVGGRPIGRKLWLCSSSSSSDHNIEPVWWCCCSNELLF